MKYSLVIITNYIAGIYIKKNIEYRMRFIFNQLCFNRLRYNTNSEYLEKYAIKIQYTKIN